MRHWEGAHLHSAYRLFACTFHTVNLNVLNAFLFQHIVNDVCRQISSIHRNIDLLQQIRQSRYDIIMRMRDKNPFDPVLVLNQIGEIRYNEFHSQLIRFRILQSGFNNKYGFIDFDNVHVLAVFVKSAKRKNAYLIHNLNTSVFIVIMMIVFLCNKEY